MSRVKRQHELVDRMHALDKQLDDLLDEQEQLENKMSYLRSQIRDLEDARRRCVAELDMLDRR